MSIRQFPLVRTCRNLHYNLTHYNPRKRVAFRSTSHPFSSNTQLIEGSYRAYFTTATARFAPSRPKHAKSKFKLDPLISRRYVGNVIAANSIFISQSIKKPDEKSPNAELRSSYLSNQDAFVKKVSSGQVEEDIILQILQKELVRVESDDINLSSNGDPSESLKTSANINSAFKVCSAAFPALQKSKPFQEEYIRLCYLKDDTRTMRHLLELYLCNKTYNSRTLSYISSHFIMNYEHAFVIGLLNDIIKLHKSLDSSLLDTVVRDLVRHDTLFENLGLVLGEWVAAGYSVSPEAASLLLHEYYIHGTPSENRQLMEIINKCGLSNNYLVKSVELQNLIVNLELDVFNYKDRLMEVKLSTNSREELLYFYTHFMQFFSQSKGRTLQDLEHLLKLFAIDGFKLRDNLALFQYVLDFVIAHTNDTAHALTLLKSTVANKKLKFAPVYIKKLYGAFVRFHPFQAPQFDQEFKSWLSMSCLSDTVKRDLSEALKIKAVSSKLVPFNLTNDPIIQKPKKYKDSQWSSMQYKKDTQGRISKDKEQLEFRMSRGFNDLVDGGVAPDPQLLLETYQRCSYSNKQILVELFKKSRVFSDYDIPLKLIELQEKNSKIALLQFIRGPDMCKITVNDKFKLARMLNNKNLHSHASKLLNSINDENLPHHSRQLKFQLQLRAYESMNDFTSFNKLVNDWPLEEIHMSSYIAQHCQYIQRKLMLKLNSLNTKHETLKDLSKFNSIFAKGEELSKIDQFFAEYPRKVEDLKNSITNLSDLTHHISHRISEDKKLVASQQAELFAFLDTWVAEAQ